MSTRSRSSSPPTTRRTTSSAFYERMSDVLEPTGRATGSSSSPSIPCTDRTEELILALRERDPRVKMLRFSRRFGQPAATLAGLEAATGDAVVVIDCDLQDPPELIAEMSRAGARATTSSTRQRRTREGETLPKRIVAARRLPRDQAHRRGRDPAEHRRLPAHEPARGRPRRRARRGARLPARPRRRSSASARPRPLRPRPARRRRRASTTASSARW